MYLTPIDDEETENPIDEYIIFQQVMTSTIRRLNFLWSSINTLLFVFFFFHKDLSAQDPQYYALLVSKLNQEQSTGLNEIMVLADQKKQHYASKLIEKQGGTCFV